MSATQIEMVVVRWSALPASLVRSARIIPNVGRYHGERLALEAYAAHLAAGGGRVFGLEAMHDDRLERRLLDAQEAATRLAVRKRRLERRRTRRAAGDLLDPKASRRARFGK